jgi:hypothetical protein
LHKIRERQYHWLHAGQQHWEVLPPMWHLCRKLRPPNPGA